MVLIETTKQFLNDLRNEIPHKKLFNEAEMLSKKLNIDLPSSEKTKKRLKKIPSYLVKYVCETNQVINELEKRFDNNSDILNGISSLDPNSKLFLNVSLILPLAQSYNCEIETLKSELKILPKSLQNYENKFTTKTNDIFHLYDFLNEYQIAFSELHKLCLISITIPVSSAGCERTFSCLKRVKNYLRNKLMDSHMSNLSVIAIEKLEAKSLNIDDIINEFASLHQN
ncbi:zinc finger MYM-type protein 1-like, partial [Aphis craccivora]